MKKHLYTTTTLIALLLCTACSQTKYVENSTEPTTTTQNTTQPATPTIKNVILVVGDGMGTAQVYASIVAQKEGSQFLRFPYTGFSRTYSNNHYTTDSGAGGSALMTGKKVDNYAIAQSPEGVPYPSFLYRAHTEAGKSTGFVVTSSVLDATPATTYGHVSYRKMFDTLSIQMAQSSLDVMIGGDKKHFLKENRKDGLAPIDTLMKRGYDIAYTLEEMEQSTNPHLCALLTQDDETGNASVRNGLLVKGVKKALSILNADPDGFVLMIEGSQIDWAGHNNDAPYLQMELADFEQMLSVVLDFAKRDGHTLVVVTADHETGGLALLDGNINEGTSECKFTTGNHSGVMVPVFSFGPFAERFSGIQQNTDIANKIMKLLGLNQ